MKKHLKTFPVYNIIEDFPKTHNLDLLLDSFSQIDNEFASIDLKNLEDFAVRVRYPHDFILPELDETNEFYEIAKAVKALVLGKIQLE